MSVVASSRSARAALVSALALALLVAALGMPAFGATGVRLVSSTERIDSVGQLVHVGEVVNDGTSTAELVRADIALYDAQDRLLDTDVTYSLVSLLKPGERSPFISYTKPPAGYHHSTVAVSAAEATEAANHRFTTRVTNDFTDDIGFRHLVGTVRNDNPFHSDFVQVVATLRDAAGKAIDADLTFVNTPDAGLAAGETGTFEFMLDPDTGFTSYSLLTEGASPAADDPASPEPEPAPEPTEEPASEEPAPEDPSAVAGSGFAALAPSRLLDTRDGTGARTGTVPSGGTLQLDVTGVGGVPATGVTAVVLNVTATGATANGFVTAYPGGQSRPNASNLNYSRGQTIPNLVIAKVSSNGTVNLYNYGGSTHLLADVVGWYSDTDAAADSRYSALTPSRLLDTRDGTGARTGTVPSGGTLQLDVTGVGGVPATGVTAVVLNVTATGATANGFVTAYPGGQSRPNASNLNYSRGQTIPNLVIAKVSSNGTVNLYNYGGSTHLLADVVGWYSAG